MYALDVKLMKTPQRIWSILSMGAKSVLHTPTEDISTSVLLDDSEMSFKNIVSK